MWEEHTVTWNDCLTNLVRTRNACAKLSESVEVRKVSVEYSAEY